MTLMRRNNPWGEMLSLRQAMDRLFEDSFVRPRNGMSGEGGAEHGIPLDISNSSDALVIEAALPGVRPEDVEITVLGDTLTISGSTASERSSEDDGTVYREVRRGRFSRTVTLPAQVDSQRATASFEHGMLRLSIPKSEAAKPHQIRIGGTSEGRAVEAGQRSEGSEGGSSQPPSGEGNA